MPFSGPSFELRKALPADGLASEVSRRPPAAMEGAGRRLCTHAQPGPHVRVSGTKSALRLNLPVLAALLLPFALPSKARSEPEQPSKLVRWLPAFVSRPAAGGKGAGGCVYMHTQAG